LRGELPLEPHYLSPPPGPVSSVLPVKRKQAINSHEDVTDLMDYNSRGIYNKNRKKTIR
jgi:hypothetical protein